MRKTKMPMDTKKRKQMQAFGNIKIITISIIAVILTVLFVLGLISYAKSDIDVTTLNIVTKNGDSTLPLKGAKYTIKKVNTDEENNETEEDAKDYYGNVIGEIENIDGVDYRVITSDENGEINLDLPSGKYRVTEIVAPTGYKLNENNTYNVELNSDGEYTLIYENKEWEKKYIMSEDKVMTLDIKETSGEEYISLVLVAKKYKIPAEEKEDGQETIVKPGVYIFRHSAENKIKEVVCLGEEDSLITKEIEKILNTRDNIAPKDIVGKLIRIVNETNSNYIIFSNDTILIFSKSGELINVLFENGVELDSNFYVSKETGNITISGTLYGKQTIPAELTEANQEIEIGDIDKENTILMQLNDEGKIKWVLDLKDSHINYTIVEYNSNIVIELECDGDISIPSEDETIDLAEGAYKLVINNGKIENVSKLNDTFMGFLYEENYGCMMTITSDNGFFSIIGIYDSYTIPAERTVNGKGIELKEDTMYVIKFNNDDKVEWVTPINMIDGAVLYYDELSNGYVLYGPIVGNIDGEYTQTGDTINIEGINLVRLKINKNGKVVYADKIQKLNNNMESITLLLNEIELENNKNVQLKLKARYEEASVRTVKNPIINTKLEKNAEIEENREKIDKKTINVVNNKDDSLQIIKQDSKTAELLPGAKFTIQQVITKEDGTTIKEDAKDVEGNLIGDIENIDGKELRVVTTNEKGEINASLPIGKYEIVEVKAPEGYYLKPSIEENTYQVEITEKQEEKKEWRETWNRVVGEGRREEASYGNNKDVNIFEEYGLLEIINEDETGVVAYIGAEQLNIPAEDTVFNKEISVNNPAIIKYNLEHKVEWVKNTIDAEKISKTSDGGYVIIGYCYNNITIPGSDVINNKPLTIDNGDVILKLNRDFIIESVIFTDEIAYITDDIYYLGTSYDDMRIPEISNITGKEMTLKEGEYLIKINEHLQIEKVIAKVDDMHKINNNEIIYTMLPKENMEMYTIDNKKVELIAGKEYLIKSNYNGDILNIFTGMDSLLEFIEDENGYLVKVYNKEDTVISADNTLTGQEITIKNYMYLKLDSNFNFINSTIDFWKDEKSFASYLEMIDVIEDGYLLKVYTPEHIDIEQSGSNTQITLYSHNETILKLNKQLQVEEKLNEIYIGKYYSSGEFITSDLENKSNGIYLLDRWMQDDTIPPEDTVGNKEIEISSGRHKILYNSEFKVIAVDKDFPIYMSNDVYLFEEYYDKDITIPSSDTVDGKEIQLKKGYSYVIYNKQMQVIRVLTGYNFSSLDDSSIKNILYIENTGEEQFSIKAEDTEENKEITIEADSNYFAFINPETLKIKKINYLTDAYIRDDTLKKVDDGYITIGDFDSKKIISGEFTESGNSIEIADIYEEYTIKYNIEGKIQYMVKGDIIKQEQDGENYSTITKSYDYSSDTFQYNLIIMDKNYNIIKEIDNFLLTTSDGGYLYNIKYKNNTTIPKENNTTGEDIFVNKGKYIAKENSEGKIEWLVKVENFAKEMVEINNEYFGGYIQTNNFDSFSLGFMNISEEKLSDQLMNKEQLNITNEADVGKVVVKYVDKATNKEIATSEELEYRTGEKYETEAKNVQYYKLDGTPENATGTVTNGVTEVIYYYNKQDFNIKTNKTISDLYVNGERQNIDGNKNNIFQVSIDRKEIKDAELKIKYVIKIENTGEIPGTAGIVTDQIPEGLEFHAEDNADYWKLQDGVAITNKLDGELIQPGESKELEIVLRCTNVGDEVGIKTNKAVAENMKNDPNFDDTNQQDDIGDCKLVVSVGLGGKDKVKVLVLGIVGLMLIADIIIKIKRKIK